MLPVTGEPGPESTPLRYIELTSFADCQEALRSPHLTVATAGSQEQHFRAGAVSKIDGPDHARRRKAMNRLLRADRHARFRSEVLYPALEEHLEEVLDRADRDGSCSFDLVDFATRVLIRLGAAIVGLDAAGTRSGVDDLWELDRAMFETAVRAHFELKFGANEPDDLARALSAKAAYVERFVTPSLDTRREMVDRLGRGALDESDLPNDLLTLVALLEDPAWTDEQMAVRESLTLLRASTHSSARNLCWAVEELSGWFEKHPEDRACLSDAGFVIGAVEEVIRLHGTVAGLMRRVEGDVELSSGKVLSAGSIAFIRQDLANVDPEVFGSDATSFNPRRNAPRSVPRYGLGFGSGPHMCFGVRLVLGKEGIDGSLVRIVQRLFEQGVTRLPGSELVDHESFVTWRHYPVRITRSFVATDY